MVNKKRVLATDRRALSVAGLRVTNQRALLLEIIRRGEKHLDAYELYRCAREKEPRLNLSTVYRALQKFKELGLVEEVHFGEAHHHYEVKQSSEHHHLVCLGCGRVVEFECPLTCQVRKGVAETTGFEITSSKVRMTGYCPQCRQGKK